MTFGIPVQIFATEIWSYWELFNWEEYLYLTDEYIYVNNNNINKNNNNNNIVTWDNYDNIRWDDNNNNNIIIIINYNYYYNIITFGDV